MTSEHSSQSKSELTSVTATTTGGVARLRNVIVALVAVILASTLFFSLRSQTLAPSLSSLEQQAVPYAEALANDRPTLVEFYANRCTSCQTMAPMLAKLEARYDDRLNLVMLNVDNDKWLPELLSYKVNGIPHFVFLDAQGNSQGMAIGEQPEGVLADNLDALIANQPLPLHGQLGKSSKVDNDRSFRSSSEASSDPRSHGAQVVKRS